MRLLATFAAVAAVTAQTDDSEEFGCPEGEFPTVDGFCTNDESFAKELAEEVMNLDSAASDSGKPRKFPMGAFPSVAGSQDRNPFFGALEERTKRRSQRMTLLMTKALAGGILNHEDGSKLKSKEFIKRVNQYGCHCWPSETKEHLSGQGKPLDELDSVCFNLRQCHKCIDIDFPESEKHPKGCDPVYTKYKAKLSKVGDDLQISCTNTLNKKGTNNGDCKRTLCECDKAFADSFAESFKLWDSNLWKLESRGLYEDMCKKGFRTAGVERLTGEGPDKCCGLYPEKKPYSSATHSCVDGVVSNDNKP